MAHVTAQRGARTGAGDARGHDLVPLFMAVLARMKSLLDAEAARHDLTLLQVHSLARLTTPSSQRDLASRLVCDASSVTAIVDRLEERGLVERHPDPDDRRVRMVVLTDAGRRLREEILDAVGDGPFSGALDDDEQRRLRDLLLRIADDDELEESLRTFRR